MINNILYDNSGFLVLQDAKEQGNKNAEVFLPEIKYNDHGLKSN
jgi:hypothetical protein